MLLARDSGLLPRPSLRSSQAVVQESRTTIQPNNPPQTPSKWFSRGKQPALRERISSAELSETTKLTSCCSYNRYLAVAARVVRRSLKEDKRLAAERRGEMDLRFAKWEVRTLEGSAMQKLGSREHGEGCS